MTHVHPLALQQKIAKKQEKGNKYWKCFQDIRI